MAFLQLKNISLAFADRDILDAVNFTLQQGQKAALTGANGSGKSTLLRILAGKQTPDSGQVVHPEGTKAAYLPQSGILMGHGSVFQEAETAFEPLAKLEDEMNSCLDHLETLSPALAEKALLRHHELQEYLLESGWYQRRETIQQTLRGLGFPGVDLDRPAASFSGGWQMRIALARCLLEKPDLLLLDEPTNYLDLEAKDWLEHFLKNYAGGFLLVSHDRGFLDSVAQEVVEIFRGDLTSYKGNYSTYEERRRIEIQQLEDAWKIQNVEIEKEEAYINRFRAKASKAAGVQSRVKALAKVERIELPESLVRMHFRFPPAPHSGRIALEIESLGKSYGEHRVLDSLDLTILRGEKIAVAGKNGAGKSTLMRLLAGRDAQFEGSLRWGTGITTAYFSQDHERDLDPQKTVLEEVEQDAPTELFPRLRDLLGSFLFRGEDVFKKTSVLSGGEKNRLTLVKLLLEPANLLLLDEPTNHLDLASKDVLLEALQQFEGTVLVVSHDKYFLSKLSQKVLELSPLGHKIHLGGWGEYQRKLDLEAETLQPPTDRARAASKPDSQRTREEDKKRVSAQRRLEKLEEAVLQDLEKLEKDHRELQAALSLPENYTNGTKVKSLQETISLNEKDQAVLQERWEALAAELDLLK